VRPCRAGHPGNRHRIHAVLPRFTALADERNNTLAHVRRSDRPNAGAKTSSSATPARWRGYDRAALTEPRWAEAANRPRSPDDAVTVAPLLGYMGDLVTAHALAPTHGADRTQAPTGADNAYCCTLLPYAPQSTCSDVRKTLLTWVELRKFELPTSCMPYPSRLSRIAAGLASRLCRVRKWSPCAMPVGVGLGCQLARSSARQHHPLVRYVTVVGKLRWPRPMSSLMSATCKR
jgi:hypothetical protein